MTERRQLGLAAAVTGQSIALGIFLTPAAMAKSLGSPLLLGAVRCGMAFMMVCGALCYSELAVRFPEAGGEYVYLREGYGRRAAFLYGWMTAAIMDPGLAAALAVGLALVVLTLGAFERIVAYIVFSAILFLGLSATTLFRLPTRIDKWWFPAAPILFAASCLIIALLILLHDPLPAFWESPWCWPATFYSTSSFQ